MVGATLVVPALERKMGTKMMILVVLLVAQFSWHLPVPWWLWMLVVISTIKITWKVKP